MYNKVVSIIVPIYNAERKLGKCIDSIQNQTYKEIEIILVNDGSTDDSINICCEKSRDDSRIRVVSIKNSGVSVARNKGLAVSTGEYCCFVDADDWIEREHIEKMVSYMEDTDCVIEGYTKENVYGNYKCQLNPVKVDLRKIDGKQIGEMFWNGYIHPCWNKLFRKTILMKNTIQFEATIHISEDSLFCLQYLLCCENMTIISDTTYHYWVDEHSSSLSKKVYGNIFDIYEKVYYSLNAVLEQGNCEENEKNEIIIRTLYPQVYSSVSKILLNNIMNRKEKRNMLKKMQQNVWCENVLQGAEKKSDNKIERIILKLILKRKYLLLEIIWKGIRKRSQ